jgi:glutamate synthase (NADPH/NADH) large chain
MTGGTAVILGTVGENFGAGMTGGIAFVYDPANKLQTLINPETIGLHRVETEHWSNVLESLVREHVTETQSRFAEQILNDWARELGHFWHVVPKEMLHRLEQPITAVAAE